MGIHSILARGHAWWIARQPRRAASALARFAKAEQGSMLTLIWAAARVSSPERRAIYLEQALEEQRHARLFTKRAAELRGNVGYEANVTTDAEPLLDTLGEIRLLAFLHRGEKRAVVEFSGYRDSFRHAGDAQTAELFAGIVEEERHHQEYPLALIETLTRDPKAAARASRFVTAWEAWRTFRRLGRFIAERAFTASVYCLFPLFLLLSFWIRWVRPETRRLTFSPEWRRAHSPRQG